MVNQGKTEIPGQNTVVSGATCIRGNVTGDTDLVVHGRIEGQIQTSQGLFIQPSGVVKADVSAGTVVIQGVLVGSVIASQSVQITAEGRVVGNISTPRFSMAEGALYRGHVETDEDTIRQMLSASEARTAAQPASRAVYQRQIQAAPAAAPSQPARSRTASSSRTAVPAPPPAARVSFKPVESKTPRSAAHLPPPPAPPPPPPPFQALLLRDEDMSGALPGDDDGTPDPVLIGKRKGALRRKK